MQKLKIVWFWMVAFTIIIKETLKGNDWHMVYVDFHYGDKPDGRPIRKQLIAKRTVSGFNIGWQDLSQSLHPDSSSKEDV